MNRPIKFRAWDGKQLSSPTTLERLCQSTPLEDFGKYTWMQFTGLLDKNGKEIYEGDIVMAYHSRLSDYEKREIAVVKWLQKIYAAWYVEFVEPKPSAILMGEDAPKCEIIGNIYENSDLLV